MLVCQLLIAIHLKPFTEKLVLSFCIEYLGFEGIMFIYFLYWSDFKCMVYTLENFQT